MDTDAIRQSLPPWLLQLAADKVQLIVSTAIILLLSLIQIRKSLQSRKQQRSLEPEQGYPPIESLPDFDWSQTEPIKLRPFKPKYNLTMALETLDPSELILMDKTYKDRLLYRRSLLHRHHDIVVATHNEDKDPRVRAAVCELYRFLFATYLPRRYPDMFRLHEVAATDTGRDSNYMFENCVMGETYPAEVPREMATEQALETILKNVDEDYLILLPDPTTSSTGEEDASSPDDVQTKYTLYAYETCYPAGFNPREKIGRRLAAIHGPVPGYKAKLERSMDRFFDRIEVGKFVKRANWGIMAGKDVELFAAFGGLHGSKEDEVENEKIPEGELDLSSTFLRCERQTLHRLPKSRALVFGFHTYTYPIAEIKAEGLGEELAAAIDGLKTGNVPEIHTYKRAPVWANAIKAYLRDQQ